MKCFYIFISGNLQTPFDWVMDKAEKQFNGVKTGSNLFRSAVLGLNQEGSFEFGLIPELIHFLLYIAPVIIPLGVLLSRSRSFTHEMGNLSRRTVTGIPIMLGVLLLLYEFVGYTGAQTLVGLVEEVLFPEQLDSG